MQMMPNECGIITRENIKSKVEELLGEEVMRARALKLREIANPCVSKWVSSFENHIVFISIHAYMCVYIYVYSI